MFVETKEQYIAHGEILALDVRADRLADLFARQAHIIDALEERIAALERRVKGMGAE